MSIKDLFIKIKVWGENSAFIFKHKAGRLFHADFFIAIVIILVAFAGFGLGRLSSLEGKKIPVLIEQNSAFPVTANETESSFGTLTTKINTKSNLSEKSFVASKFGTKYYFPWCGGVSNIKETNKIWFSSETEAKKVGYTPATNCAGLR